MTVSIQAPHASLAPPAPNPEAAATAKRRQCSSHDKRRILAAAAALLVDLEVAKTYSRPHVSDDNPYSEAQFNTLNYRSDFPERFGRIEDARAHCQRFFP